MDLIVFKRGFELLKTRSLSDRPDVSSLENKFGVEIPPMYRLFVETFYPNVNTEIYTNEGVRIKHFQLGIRKKDRLYELDEFFSLEQSLENFDEWEDWYDENRLYIAMGPPEGGIVLGLSGEEKDKIIYSYAHQNTVIGENVFEFMQSVVLIDSTNL